MTVGLVDVDGHNFPNLALMKLSAHHKQRGDHVQWYNPLFPVDKVYLSKVFTFTRDVTDVFCDDVERGGSGYDVGKQLPAAVDALYPDYTLYGITDTAYGYLTRGCPRQCGFCIVGEKEGTQARQLYKLEQFWRGQPHIKLLDPNITAAANCVDLLSELAATGAEVDFTQGLDLRMLTDAKLAALSRVRTRVVHFAWDEPAEEGVICERLGAYIRATGAPYERICVYVLVNYNTSFAEDLHRIYRIRDIGANPYVMIYNKETAAREYRDLQRWCNNRRIFRSVLRFEEYSPSKRKQGRWDSLPELPGMEVG